jgi:hypothetical protein
MVRAEPSEGSACDDQEFKIMVRPLKCGERHVADGFLVVRRRHRQRLHDRKHESDRIALWWYLQLDGVSEDGETDRSCSVATETIRNANLGS